MRAAVAFVLALAAVSLVSADAQSYISGKLDSLEPKVQAARDFMQNKWAIVGSDEGASCSFEDACDLSSTAQASLVSNTTRFPDPYSFEYPTHKIKGGINPSDPRVISEICACEDLHDQVWVPTYDGSADREIQYQFFGGQETGLISIAPGYEWDGAGQDKASCEAGSYDPRFRPWYSSAVTGPKDIVIILDTSGSMAKADRLTIAKDAAKAVLDTLSFYDYVGLVSFNSATDVFATELQQLTDAKRTQMSDWIDSLNANGGTFMDLAFTAAFDMLDASKTSGSTSNCHSAVLFLTDGENSGNDPLPIIADRNTDDLDARIFTYTLGSGASKTVPQKIACKSRGIHYHVEDGDPVGLRDVMAGYYVYFATGLKLDDVKFSEIYLTSSGTYASTGTMAVYDTTTTDTKLVFGVVAVDVNADVLTTNAPGSEGGPFTIQQANDIIYERSKSCPSLDLSDAQIEELRPEGSKCNNWIIILIAVLGSLAGLAMIAGLVKFIRSRSRSNNVQEDGWSSSAKRSSSDASVPQAVTIHVNMSPGSSKVDGEGDDDE